MPIKVMPIWTADRKRPGSEPRRSAVCAPRRPAFAIALSRGLRDETIASSAIAKTPFKAMRPTMMTTSDQGKGVMGDAGGMGCLFPLGSKPRPCNGQQLQPLCRVAPVPEKVAQQEARFLLAEAGIDFRTM